MLPERFGTYLCREGCSLTLTGDPCDSTEKPEYVDDDFPVWNKHRRPALSRLRWSEDAGHGNCLVQLLNFRLRSATPLGEAAAAHSIDLPLFPLDI